MLAHFVSVLSSSAALRLERDSGLSGGAAHRPKEPNLVECPWGEIQAHGTTASEDTSAAQHVCGPEISDWQVEYGLLRNESRAARVVPPSSAELHDEAVMREAVRELKQKSKQPHVVFIGDSMMRQHYFNLASWMIHGEARPEEPEALPTKDCNYQDFWRAVYVHQNAQLRGDGVSEICHCGREDQKGKKDAVFVEDRFVTLPGNGSSLSYFGWFGDWSFHGYFNPSNERPTQASCKIGKCTSPFRWTVKQPGWQDATGVVNLLSKVVMKMQPKPTHVVVNSGKWGHLTRLGLRKLFAAGAEIQKRDGIKFMWKTVSHSRSDTDNEHDRFVETEVTLARQYGWEVFDAYKMTSSYPLRGQYYRDELHFSERVVTRLNRMYLEKFLASLQ